MRGRRVHREPVAAGLLGVVHRQVGVDDHVLGRHRRSVEQRDAEAHGHRAPPAVELRGALADVVEQALAERLRLVLVGHREQHGALVAAEAGDRVGGAQALEQHAGHPDDQLVAGVVAERVVDRLEVVDVEHEQRAAGAVARHLGEVAADLELEAAPVEQTRQRVVVGHVLQLLLEALALGDVLDLGEQVVGPSLGVAHDGDVHLHAHRVPRGGDVALVALEARPSSSSADPQRPPGEHARSSGCVIASSQSPRARRRRSR